MVAVVVEQLGKGKRGVRGGERGRVTQGGEDRSRCSACEGKKRKQREDGKKRTLSNKLGDWKEEERKEAGEMQ